MSVLLRALPRNSSFEKGFSFQYAEKPYNNSEDRKRNMKLIPDTLVKDDQAIIANVRDKGLVIITGCGYAGIINMVNYARGNEKVTGNGSQAPSPTMSETTRTHCWYSLLSHVVIKLVQVVMTSYLMNSF
jgi:hypothetical protein